MPSGARDEREGEEAEGEERQQQLTPWTAPLLLSVLFPLTPASSLPPSFLLAPPPPFTLTCSDPLCLSTSDWFVRRLVDRSTRDLRYLHNNNQQSLSLFSHT